MFFADPAVAFTNLHQALRAGGQLAFVCWQSMMDNPWMTVPMAAALQHIPPPPIPAPGAPGPFAFADPDRVREILASAGFSAVALEPVRMTLSIGGGNDLDTTVDFILRMGPAARALREADDPDLQPLVAASVREALAPYQTADAGVMMDSASWIVTAPGGGVDSSRDDHRGDEAALEGAASAAPCHRRCLAGAAARERGPPTLLAGDALRATRPRPWAAASSR
jgi:hypothetical protein